MLVGVSLTVFLFTHMYSDLVKINESESVSFSRTPKVEHIWNGSHFVCVASVTSVFHSLQDFFS